MRNNLLVEKAILAEMPTFQLKCSTFGQNGDIAAETSPLRQAPLLFNYQPTKQRLSNTLQFHCENYFAKWNFKTQKFSVYDV